MSRYTFLLEATQSTILPERQAYTLASKQMQALQHIASPSAQKTIVRMLNLCQEYNKDPIFEDVLKFAVREELKKSEQPTVDQPPLKQIIRQREDTLSSLAHGTTKSKLALNKMKSTGATPKLPKPPITIYTKPSAMLPIQQNYASQQIQPQKQQIYSRPPDIVHEPSASRPEWVNFTPPPNLRPPPPPSSRFQVQTPRGFPPRPPRGPGPSGQQQQRQQQQPRFPTGQGRKPRPPRPPQPHEQRYSDARSKEYVAK